MTFFFFKEHISVNSGTGRVEKQHEVGREYCPDTVTGFKLKIVCIEEVVQKKDEEPEVESSPGCSEMLFFLFTQ